VGSILSDGETGWPAHYHSTRAVQAPNHLGSRSGHRRLEPLGASVTHLYETSLGKIGASGDPRNIMKAFAWTAGVAFRIHGSMHPFRRHARRIQSRAIGNCLGLQAGVRDVMALQSAFFSGFLKDIAH
jgi:hypothetical protein